MKPCGTPHNTGAKDEVLFPIETDICLSESEVRSETSWKLLTRMGQAEYSAIFGMMVVSGAMLVLMSWIFCFKKDTNFSQWVCEVARRAEGAGFINLDGFKKGFWDYVDYWLFDWRNILL